MASISGPMFEESMFGAALPTLSGGVAPIPNEMYGHGRLAGPFRAMPRRGGRRGGGVSFYTRDFASEDATAYPAGKPIRYYSNGRNHFISKAEFDNLDTFFKANSTVNNQALGNKRGFFRNFAGALGTYGPAAAATIGKVLVHGAEGDVDGVAKAFSDYAKKGTKGKVDVYGTVKPIYMAGDQIYRASKNFGSVARDAYRNVKEEGGDFFENLKMLAQAGDSAISAFDDAGQILLNRFGEPDAAAPGAAARNAAPQGVHVTPRQGGRKRGKAKRSKGGKKKRATKARKRAAPKRKGRGLRTYNRKPKGGSSSSCGPLCEAFKRGHRHHRGRR